MTAPRYARLASKVLADREPEAGPPPDPHDRSRAIAALEHALAQRANRRRSARWIASAAAAAAIVAATVGGVRYLGHRPVVATRGGTVPVAEIAPRGVRIVGHAVAGAASVAASGEVQPLADGRVLSTGNRIVTSPTGRVLLAFSTGTDALLEEDGDVTLDALGSSEQLRLDSGAIDLHVAKQGVDERFVVRTPDAEVEVRGTHFRVSIGQPDPTCGGGTTTRVAVSEGVVVVRHAGSEASVAAGEHWPAGCATRATSDASPAPSDSPAAAHAAAPPANPSSPSTLAEQNDLFAEAVAAKRRGDSAGALAGFDRFLTRYPRSPLAENAAVERMRLLRGSDSVRAAAAARAYLARYPAGFAHTEAEAIAAESP